MPREILWLKAAVDLREPAWETAHHARLDRWQPRHVALSRAVWSKTGTDCYVADEVAATSAFA